MELPTKEGWYWVEYNHRPGESTVIQVIRQNSGVQFRGGLGVMQRDERTNQVRFTRVENMAVKWIKKMED